MLGNQKAIKQRIAHQCFVTKANRQAMGWHTGAIKNAVKEKLSSPFTIAAVVAAGFAIGYMKSRRGKVVDARDVKEVELTRSLPHIVLSSMVSSLLHKLMAKKDIDKGIEKAHKEAEKLPPSGEINPTVAKHGLDQEGTRLADASQI